VGAQTTAIALADIEHALVATMGMLDDEIDVIKERLKHRKRNRDSDLALSDAFS